MKWRARSVKNISLVLILIFIIIRLTGLAWNSPFYTTPTEKTFNVIKLYGVGLGILGSAFYLRFNPERFDTHRPRDYLIAFNYIVWIILWETLDFTDPILHYGGMLVGILIITFVRFGMRSHYIT